MEIRSTDLLPPELIAELATHGEVRSYARNEQLFIEGDVSDAVFVLVSGQLKVFTKDRRGRELVYNVLHPGELFGELFLDGEARSASVRAITHAQCIVVDEVLTRTFITTYPAFAEFLIVKLIKRLRHATQQIKQLGFSDVYARTVALLEEEAVLEADAQVIPSALTQQEIADRVGATREMINHVLRDLVQGGFLARDDQRRLLIVKPMPRRR